MRVRIERTAQTESPIASVSDLMILAAGAAIVFTSGVVQLVLPLLGIESVWPTGFALLLDGAFLPMLSRIMWNKGIFTRKRWGIPAIIVAWGTWLVAVWGLAREITEG